MIVIIIIVVIGVSGPPWGLGGLGSTKPRRAPWVCQRKFPQLELILLALKGEWGSGYKDYYRGYIWGLYRDYFRDPLSLKHQ